MSQFFSFSLKNLVWIQKSSEIDVDFESVENMAKKFMRLKLSSKK
jgi:hypothetical protein